MKRTILAAALALAACTNPAPNAIPAEAGGAKGSSPTRGGVDDAVPAAAPATPVPGIPVTKSANGTKLTFPTAFQGHWGLTAADCDISRPDAPGLMKISGATLDFHDSTATARALTMRDPYRIVADLDFKAGDRTWQRREMLSLEIGGTRLARSEAGGTFRYEHC